MPTAWKGLLTLLAELVTPSLKRGLSNAEIAGNLG
jgi:hypothetical protein